MGMYFRRFTIRLMIPIVWNLSKKRAARALQTFSATEADSAWQFLYVLDRVEDPELRAELFHNAMEEIYHSSEFDKLSKLCSDDLMTRPTPMREPIYDPDKPFASFLAYVYVGEKDVYDQFDAYSLAIKKAAITEGGQQTIFDEAKEDEDGHLELAREALMKEYNSARDASREIFKIRARRAYNTWLRFSKHLGEFSSAILLSALYFVSGPFFTLTCRKKMNQSGEKQSFEQQVADFSPGREVIPEGQR